MFIITVEGMENEGAFAVKDSIGDKVVFLFEEEDDAMRYSIQLEACGTICLLYTSPSPRDLSTSRMPSSA